MKNALIFMVAMLTLTLFGCSKPTAQQIDATIDLTAPVLIQGALTHFAVKSPAATKEAATLLSQSCDDATALLANNTLPATQLLPLLEQTLLKKIPGTYESITVGALALLTANIDLTAPTMSAVELAHCQHCVSAIKAGCTLFLNGKVAHLYTPATPYVPPVADAADNASERVPSPVTTQNTNNTGKQVGVFDAIKALKGHLDTYKGEVIPPPRDVVVSRGVANVQHYDKPCMAAAHRHTDEYALDCQADYSHHDAPREVVRKRIDIAPERKEIKTAAVEVPLAKVGDVITDRVVTNVDPKGFILVEFKAKWCGPCTRNAANIDTLKSDPAGYNQVYVIDVDDNEAAAQQCEVTTIPCQIIFKEGIQVDRHYGVHDRAEMVKWLGDAK